MAAQYSGLFSDALNHDRSSRRRVDWATLVHLIHASHPVAAESLYRLYADGLRLFLRRHSGAGDVEDSVYIVLLQAARAVRDHQVDSLDLLTKHVRELAHSQIERLRSAAPPAPAIPDERLERLSENLSAVLTKLTLPEREILLRAYMLEQTDREISEETGITETTIRRTRAKAKAMFRQMNRTN